MVNRIISFFTKLFIVFKRNFSKSISFQVHLLFALSTILSCNGLPYQTTSQYWEDFYGSHNSLREAAFLGGEYNILFSGLIPEKEAIMQKKNDNHLYITGSVTKKNNKFYSSFSGEQLAGEEIMNVVTNYILSDFNNKETYKVSRITHYKLNNLTISNFIQWISKFIENTPEESILAKSEFYNSICSYYKCQLKENKNEWNLKIAPLQKLNKLDPVHYVRSKKFLENSLLDIQLIGEESGVIFQIKNDKDNYEIVFQKKKINQKLGNFFLKSNIKIEYYGLKFDIKNLTYKLNIQKLDNKEMLSGKYEFFPDVKISGRLWHVLPPFLINAFIPGNMDEYVKNYFDMILKGNDGKGNNFQIINDNKNTQFNLIVKNEYETFRKPFRFVSSKPKKENEFSPFLSMLQDSIIKDSKNQILFQN
jgi:hypothetical protein